jgi:hypothetical protein
MKWDDSQHDQVNKGICGNGDLTTCPILGYMRHLGFRFSPTIGGGGVSQGLPVTASADVTGPVGGFGWLLTLNQGAPRTISFQDLEVQPETTMLLTIVYPLGTTFNITAHAAEWCSPDESYTCLETFELVNSMDQVRNGPGNTYYVDSSTGALTFRLVQTAQEYLGNPDWIFQNYEDAGRYSKSALHKFERGGILLPKSGYGTGIILEADCSGTGAYCVDAPNAYDPDVCPAGYQQVAYDSCCSTATSSVCMFADGSTTSSKDTGSVNLAPGGDPLAQKAVGPPPELPSSSSSSGSTLSNGPSSSSAWGGVRKLLWWFHVLLVFVAL